MQSLPAELYTLRLPPLRFLAVNKLRFRQLFGLDISSLLFKTWQGSALEKKIALFGSILLILLPFLMAALVSCFYLASSVAANATGQALPLASPLTASPFAVRIAKNFTLHNVNITVLAWVLCGIAWEWVSSLPGTSLHGVRRPVKAAFSRLSIIGGPVCILALLLLQIGLAWAGRQSGYFDIFGLFSYSDAMGYWDGMLQAQETGQWSAFTSRRPVAAALRSAVGLGGSYRGMLIIQTCLLSFSAWLACRSISRWKGPWASVCFFLFCLNVATPFITSTATESLGFILVLLAIPSLVGGRQTRSIGLLLISISILWFALLARMGAMFLPLTLGIWLLFHARFSRRMLQWTALCLTGVAISGLLYSAALQKLYAAPSQTQGSNFACVAYGLSVNKDWSAAYTDFKEELPQMKNETEMAVFWMMKAKEAFQENPKRLFRALASNVFHGTKNLFKMSIRSVIVGYNTLGLYDYLVICAMLPGLFLIIRRRGLRTERGFFLAVTSGIILSVAIVYRDAGSRALCIAFPFLWVCYCSLLSGPTCSPTKKIGWEPPVSILAAILLLLFALIAPSITVKENSQLPSQEGMYIRGGNKSMAGVLVVENGSSLPRDIPAIHYKTFVNGFKKFFKTAVPEPFWPDAPFYYRASFFKQNGQRATSFFFMPNSDILRSPSSQVWQIDATRWSNTTELLNSWVGTQQSIVSAKALAQ